MDLLKAMQSFVGVVNTGSFAAAAGQLGVSPGIVTRNVQLLEEHLGARLINRTTRSLSVTDAGKDYHGFCARILAEMNDAEAAISNLQDAPSGVLKILIPKSFGALYMGEALSSFMNAYPDLRVEATLSDYTIPSIDLIESGFDAAIRLTAQRDSTIVARRIATTRWVLCASPAYVAAHGEPNTPADFEKHRCLVHAIVGSTAWPLPRTGKRRTINIKASLTTNSVLLLRDFAVRGAGIALLPTYAISSDLSSGALLRLMRSAPYSPTSIQIVYPHGKLLPKKVRLFIDFMAARFKPAPWSAHDKA